MVKKAVANVNEKIPVIQPMRAPLRILRAWPVRREYIKTARNPVRNATRDGKNGTGSNSINGKTAIRAARNPMRTASRLWKLISSGGCTTGAAAAAGGGTG